MTTTPALLALCLSATLAVASAAAAAPGAAPLDLSRVTAVRITGGASRITLETAPGGPYAASVGDRHRSWLSFWYSGWFFDGCRNTGSLRLAGTTLVVEVPPQPWLSLADCRVAVRARLPEGIAVAIAQDASDARLSGRFSAVTLDNGAADIALRGTAGEVRLGATAMRARLDFGGPVGRVAIAAQSLDAELSFVPGTEVSYEVRALAALVDSALPDTPGAATAIAISGDYVLARIR